VSTSLHNLMERQRDRQRQEIVDYGSSIVESWNRPSLRAEREETTKGHQADDG